MMVPADVASAYDRRKARARNGMTSISGLEPAALLILQQSALSAAPAEESKETDAKRTDLVQVANGISGEPAKETIRAAFAINAAFVEMDEKSQLLSDAIDFINSDQFKISDPIAKNMLKGLLAEKGWQFAQLVNQQYEAHGGFSRESLFALALPQMINKNRDLFTDDELYVGIKFKEKGGVVVLIPDKDGNSTYRDLTRALKEEEVVAAQTGNREALQQLQEEYGKFVASINLAFDYEKGPPMLLDIDDLPYAPWISKPSLPSTQSGGK